MDDDNRTIEAPAELVPALDALGQGDEITLTRAGRPIARVVPIPVVETAEADPSKAAFDEERYHRIKNAFNELQKIARTVKPKVTIEEIIAWKNEGRA